VIRLPKVTMLPVVSALSRATLAAASARGMMVVRPRHGASSSAVSDADTTWTGIWP